MEASREALEDFRRLTTASTRAGLYVLREEGKTPAALATLVDSTYEQAAVMVERVNAKYDPQQRHLPVCAEGCAWCCYFSVLVAPAEALRIAEHLRATRTDAELAAMRARVREVAEKTRDVSQEERMKMRVACPMLDVERGSCTVHDARPGMCRAYNSCDVKACVTAYETSDLRAPIPGNRGQQDATTSVWVGMLAASALAGLDATVVELSAAVDLALNEHDAAARWLAGERLFEAARTKASQAGAVRATAATQAAMKVAREQFPGEVPAAPRPATDSDAARRARNEKKRAKKRR